MTIQERGSSAGAHGVSTRSSSARSRRLSNTNIWFWRGCLSAAIIFWSALPHARVNSAQAIDTEAAMPSDTPGAHVQARGMLRKSSKSSRDRHSGPPSDTSKARGECVPNSLWRNAIDPKNYEFGCNEIEEMLKGNMTLVGQGHIRDVYLVKYGGKMVVVKTLKEQAVQRKQKARYAMHRREVLAMDAVKGHRNIIGMLGVCNTTVVTEYYPDNFSKEVLHRKETPPIHDIVSKAVGAAKGLQALHEAVEGPIVHFDIKPQQLLIDQDGRVMINDFNMARFMGTGPGGVPCSFTVDGEVRVVAWRSPESIEGKSLTEKVDIYSMGMVFYSLIAGQVPFSDKENPKLSILSGEEPTIDPSWNGGYMEVVRAMWRKEPTKRPSAREVVNSLEMVLQQLPQSNAYRRGVA